MHELQITFAEAVLQFRLVEHLLETDPTLGMRVLIGLFFKVSGVASVVRSAGWSYFGSMHNKYEIIKWQHNIEGVPLILAGGCIDFSLLGLE